MNANSTSRARRVAACALSVVLTTGATVGIAASASAAPATSVVTGLSTSTIVSPDGVAEVRSGPGVGYPSVARLHSGDHVTVLGTSGGWSRVGINQWIASWLIRPGSATPSQQLWRVQIGASQSRSRANEIAATARARGFQTYVRHVGGWYRVQVGAFAVRSNANAMVTRARNAGFTDAFARTD